MLYSESCQMFMFLIWENKIKNGAFERVYFKNKYLPNWHYASSCMGSILGDYLPEAKECNHIITNTYFDRVCLN